MSTSREKNTSPAPDWSPLIVGGVVALIAGRWHLRILNRLEAGPLRRTVLREQVGPISDKVLTESLRRLEGAGLVYRTMIPTVPIEVDYALTPLAGTLRRLLVEIHLWGTENAVPTSGGRTLDLD
ncbi:MAG: helix-turn-helix transcriptional regulator [Actinobacteria bacterium]|nr:helix-turn-helix transcriptional regulator [Actinomycetota bacterium]